MSTPERRSFQRRQMSGPVTLAVPDPVELRGEAVNASKKGMLLETRGRLSVTVTLNGREYRGWLARAYRVELNTFAYAIELEDDLEVDDLR